jgi:hypothetical protein
MFASRGIRCIGVTPALEKPSPGGNLMVASTRAEEITSWLSQNPGVTRYAIVDDDRDADDGTGRYVSTGSFEGLLERHIARLEQILTHDQ